MSILVLILIISIIVIITICLLSLLIILLIVKHGDPYKKLRNKQIKNKNNIFFNKNKILFTIILGNKQERIDNVNNLISKLKTKFDSDIEIWPAIYTKPCPKHLDKTTKPNERGLLLAHKQLWDRFIVSNYDTLVIFEDDAILSSEHSIELLQKELLNMKTHLLYLGYKPMLYSGNIIKPFSYPFGGGNLWSKIPFATHAYAITKNTAQILIDNFDQCGLPVDLYIMSLYDKLDWTTVNKPNNEKPSFDKGLFHQQTKFKSMNTNKSNF